MTGFGVWGLTSNLLLGARFCCYGDGRLEELFDRGPEKSYFKRFVKRRGQLLLVTGPPDCGKSAVLRHLSNSEAGVGLVDLRGGDFSTADVFTTKMTAVLTDKKLLDLDNLDVNIGVSVMGTSLALSGHVAFQEMLWSSLEKRKSRHPVPTLIIDEANLLQEWGKEEQNQKALESFLRFFVKITKQDELANVILATSDYLFRYWLDAQIGASRYSKQAIGDFVEAEARGFFHWALGEECPDELWESVYRTCGGRALLLKRAASMMVDGLDNWPQFGEELFDEAYDELFLATEPENLVPKAVVASWTDESLMRIVKAMCEHEQGVMAWKQLQSLCGAKVANALVCYNLVHCRSKSQLNRDLTWYKGAWPVVTPVSPVQFLAMQSLVAGN